jgi:hypothetical protein
MTESIDPSPRRQDGTGETTITYVPLASRAQPGPLQPLTDPHRELRQDVDQALDRLDRLFGMIRMTETLRQEFYALRDQLGRVKINLHAGITFA